MKQTHKVEFGYLDLFKNSHFVFLWLVQTFTQIATSSIPFILAIHLYTKAQSNLTVSLLLVVMGAPSILFSSFAGVLVDRWHKKMILFFSNLLRALVLCLVILIPQEISHLSAFILVFIIALLNQFFIPAQSAMIPAIMEKHNLMIANAVFNFTTQSALLFGAIAGGALFRIFGFSHTLKIIMLLFLSASILALFLPPKGSVRGWIYAKIHQLINRFNKQYQPSEAPQAHPKTQWLREIKEGIQIIRGNDLLFFAFSVIFLARLFIITFIAVVPGYVDQTLSLRVEDASMILLLPAAMGMVAGGLFLGQYGRHRSKVALIRFGLICGIISLLCMAVFGKIGIQGDLPGLDIIIFAVAFLLGAQNTVIFLPTQTLLHQYIPKEARGRVFGTLETVAGIAVGFPVLAAGWLADRIGPTLIPGLLSIVGIIFMLLMWPKFKPLIQKESA